MIYDRHSRLERDLFLGWVVDWQARNQSIGIQDIRQRKKIRNRSRPPIEAIVRIPIRKKTLPG